MKIQGLAIIFIIIVLPITIIIGEYASTQIEILKLEQAYDSRLITATHDALKAFQINTFNDATSEMADSKIESIEASVNAFYNALESSFGLEGYSKENLQMYVPALVYTMYDGYYIYSPYKNIADISAENGSVEIDLTDGEVDYGFKPYVYYSCRYVKGNIDVIINYSLDNYITVQGTIGDEAVYKSGYLLTVASSQSEEGVYYNSNEKKYYYCGIQILEEANLADYLVDRDSEGNVFSKAYKYIKLNGTKYYLNDKDDDGDGVIDEYIFYIMGGNRIKQVTKATNEEEYNKYVNQIETNSSAISYYRYAYEFSNWVYDNLGTLKPSDAVIGDDDSGVKNSGTGPIFVNSQSSPIEYTGSSFNLHRKEVIRNSIESNLSVAIANFNSYTSSTNDFQMPKLKETDWEMLENNISVISFLQGLNLGGKIYNGYTVVTNTKTEEVVKEESIYITVDENGDTHADYYHKINDKHLAEEFTVNLVEDNIIAGVLDLDFELRKDGVTGYSYTRKKELACYTSIIGQENMDNSYDSIYEYLQSLDNSEAVVKKVKQLYYTALARERWGTYKVENPSYAKTVLQNMAPMNDYDIVTDGLIRFYDASNIDGNGNAGNSTTTLWRDLSGNYNGIINGATANASDYVSFDGDDDWINAGKINVEYVTFDVQLALKEYPSNTGTKHDYIIGDWESNIGGSGLYVETDGTVVFAFYDDKGNGYKINSTTSLQLNKKYDIAATYDGKEMKIYINGVSENSEVVSGKIGALQNNTVLAMGTNSDGNGVENWSNLNYSNMNIYTVMVYDRALTEDEIEKNYKETTGRTPTQEPEYYAPTIAITNLSISPNRYLSSSQQPILSAEITVNNGGTLIDSVQYVFTQETTEPSEGWTSLDRTILEDGSSANATVSKQVTTTGIWYLFVKASSGTAEKTGYAIFEEILEDNTPPVITIDDSADHVTNGQYEIAADATSITIAKLISATDDGSGMASLISMYSTSSSMPADIDTAGHKSITSTVDTYKATTPGTYYLHVKAIDNAGNESTKTVEYTVTKEEEEVTYTIEIVNTDSNETGVYNISTNSRITLKKQISVTSSNGDTENLTIKYSFVKGSASSEGTPTSWTTYTTDSTISNTVKYADYGYYYLHIKVYDASGNEVATLVQKYIFNGERAYV